MHRRAKICATFLAALLACLAVLPGAGAATRSRSKPPHKAAPRCVPAKTKKSTSSKTGKRVAKPKKNTCVKQKASKKKPAKKKPAKKKPAKKKPAKRKPAKKPAKKQPARSQSQPDKTAVSSAGVSKAVSWAGWNILANPIDSTQQTAVPWGTRSDYLQPWRAYLDTRPASALRSALGINFNVPAEYASAVAQFLGQVGFRRARVEIAWGGMSFNDPSQLKDTGKWDTILGALKTAGIRPLILLNVNDGVPGPVKTFDAQITQPAAAGATTVQVDAFTAQQLVPGMSGFNVPGGAAATFLATSVSPSGLVTLSQPLPVAIPAGTYGATTLRFQPFAPPFTASGQRNPAFEQTLSGWLLYVKAVTQEASKVLGPNGFDVEVWNELSFGSKFLSAANYYNPVPPSLQGTGSVNDQLLARTVAWLRDPANGVPNVPIGDGFANQDPQVAGSTVPNGVTAIDRHPYYGGIKELPGYAGSTPKIRNVNALGQQEGAQDFLGNWSRPFLPRYRSFFPEYFLSAIETDYMGRDLSPITTMVGNVAHGRSTMPAGASAPPQVWITETNFRPNEAGSMTTAQMRHVQAKSALRTLSAFVNKGVTALDFYAVGDGDWALLDPSAPGGGETMVALQRFMQAFAGPSTIATPRSLSLSSIADQGNWSQFAGDGTAAHPPLYNRNVVAFFPFQTDSSKFVVPVYVMTRDMSKAYNTSVPSTATNRFDLPPQTYRLTIGGLNTARLRVSATDPDTGASVPATIVSTSGSSAVVEIPLTDSPRLLVLQDG